MSKKKPGKSVALTPAVMIKPWDATEGAVIVFSGIDKIAELAALAAESADITSITNADGREQVHALRMVLKNRRLEITGTGLSARRDALKFNKNVTALEDDYIALIEPEENRLQKLQDDYDAKLEQEKQALIDAEIARQAALQERIAELRGCQILSATSGSALIAEHIADLERIAVDESFEECREQAEAAKAEGLARLDDLFLAAVAYEAEQIRVADDRAELERLRTEAAARNAADAERERVAKVERDAEAVRHAAQLKQQAEDLAKEQAARQKIIDENNARIATEQLAAQEKLDAEAKRQADAAQEIARQQEELRKAKEPKLVERGIPTVTEATQIEVIVNSGSERTSTTWTVCPAPAAEPIAIPSREQIVAALCDHFVLDEAQILAILARIDWQEALAEAA